MLQLYTPMFKRCITQSSYKKKTGVYKDIFEKKNPSKVPQEKIIKTLIYGNKFSSNQAEYALQTASASKSEYTEANIVIPKDVYVDDCSSGAKTKEEAMQLTDEIQIILSRGGFRLNGFTFCGESPTESLSGDNKSIKFAGIK